ncbi:hypothetical protein BSKO_08251 [Bryopsis sp. KO-2023]|nr:hypothetical protein BSKO_08251 [Bryopsis sp. KO-2023]
MKADLRTFILRGEVIRLYRGFLREARRFPADTKGDILGQIRHQFDINRGAFDPYAIKYLLSDGRAQLKSLKSIIEKTL